MISVDIRNHSTLLDSLEQYVKGELLEGADAYHCDNCNKKVSAVPIFFICTKIIGKIARWGIEFRKPCR